MSNRLSEVPARDRSRAAVVLALVMGTSLIAGCATSVSAPQATSTFGPDAAEATVHPNPTPSPTIEPGLTPTGPTQTARVVRIVDGDTIVVSMNGKNFKLRYIGMDTPEDVDPNSPVEPMGREAAAANQKLVAGRTVVLEKDVSETDRYGRLLRYVWLHQGSTWTLVNLELVRLGFASAVSYPPDVKYDEVFAPAEAGAQTSLVGLWAPDATAAPTVAPKPTPKPTPRPTPKPTKVASRCHPSYDPCLPIVGDLDCPDVRAMGLAPVHVIGPDDYRLDRDHDGLGCE